MDKLIQTSKGCAQHSRSQECSFMHTQTHTLTHTQAPSAPAAQTSFTNNKDMTMCHFLTSRCFFEWACVLSLASLQQSKGVAEERERFVGSEVIKQAVCTGSATVHIDVIPKHLQIEQNKSREAVCYRIVATVRVFKAPLCSQKKSC